MTNIADMFKSIELAVQPQKLKERKPLPSGIKSLDRITGGGLQRGRMTEVYGSSVSGKTALSYQYVKQCKKIALLFDAKYSFDLDKAEMMGVDMSNLMISQLSDPMQIAKMIEYLSALDMIDLIIIDDIASLDYSVLHSEAEAIHRFKMAVKKSISNTDIALLNLNQVRTTPFEGDKAYGSRRTHSEDAGFELTRLKSLSRANARIGSQISLYVKYSRSYKPGGKTILNVLFEGITDGNKESG